MITDKKITWRRVLNWALLVCMATILVWSYLREKDFELKLKEASSIKPVPKTEVSQKAEEISREIDAEGRVKVIYRLKEALVQRDHKLIDSFANVAKVDKNRIKNLETILGSLFVENKELKKTISLAADGLPDTSWKYEDPWLAIDVGKRDSGLTLKSVWADASVNKVTFDKKKFWFFGKNEERATVWFNSPYARVNGLTTLSLKNPEPFFDIDINVGGKYLHNQKQLLLGPSIRLGVGRLGLKGGYYVNPAGNIGNGAWYGADWKIY